MFQNNPIFVIMTTFTRILLSPLAFIYKVITNLRNHFYNIGHKKSHQFNVLTIGVGNLKVGGVGKTPFSEYLISGFLNQEKKVAYLSRGYGRGTKGFLAVNKRSTSNEVGDEALQVALNFPEVNAFVCEDRVLAIPEILHTSPQTNTVVLDDVYQHRRIRPHVNLLLTAYNDLFVDDMILPSGRLRESRENANRAHLVIVTKTPEASTNSEKEEVLKKLTPYLRESASVLFAYSCYKNMKWVLGDSNTDKKVITVSALANNDVFVREVESRQTVVKSFDFRDHHYFTSKEIEEIITFASKQDVRQIVTTEKDWQRLKIFKEQFVNAEINIAVLPFYFKLDDEQVLWDLIKNEDYKI